LTPQQHLPLTSFPVFAQIILDALNPSGANSNPASNAKKILFISSAPLESDSKVIAVFNQTANQKA
jgi:hypothetical protein